MKYIKSVHRHGSEIFLLVIKDDKNLKPTSIIKSSTSKNGIKSIISECEGINWYNNHSTIKIEYNLEKKIETYYRINIKVNKSFFNINPNKEYSEIKNYLDLAINHYIKIWHNYREHEYAPFHGDLSLVGNVMFNSKNEVLIVDWEQFDGNMKMPTGLDIIMTLMENIYYEEIRFKKIKRNVMEHFVNSAHDLYQAKLLSPLLFHNTASNALDFINSNLNIWKGQHSKLPALKLSSYAIREIDNAISKII
jgi:hypothetical protein